ncbi:alpha/beta fold hydrolase [Zavarzinia sp. CC-PAN008]|uniref:alpha/beta fold hydrolase n=1 Tax=Zavarzinia sp. CC-PAN008 TaxID=3243332 RepID=UPI003F7470E1
MTLKFRTPDGLNLAADAYGDATHPPVLLCHGGGQTRHAWGGTARTLAAAGWYAVTLDLRGHGDSDWDPEGDYRLDRYAHDALAVAAALPNAPVVVGASLGGMSSMLAQGDLLPEGRVLDQPLASDLRRGFAGLVLVDITPRIDPEGVQKILGFMASHVETGFETLEEAADAIAGYLPHRPRPRSLDGLAKNLRLRDDGRYRWHWDPRFVNGDQRPGGSRMPDRLTEAARRLDLPTMLVRGKSSELVSEAHAREFLELVPHAHYVDVSGAGHMVAGDRNDAFTDAVLGFLANHTRG